MNFALWLLLGIAQAIDPVTAHPPTAWQDPGVPVADIGLKLAAGTPLELQLLDGVSSRGKRGDRFRIRLSEPLLNGDIVVVPAGAEGMGEITYAAKAGMAGKPGELLLAARYLLIDGRQVHLRAFHLGGTGRDRSIAAVTVALVTGPFALFMQGGEIEVPAGATGVAKLAEDFVMATPVVP